MVELCRKFVLFSQYYGGYYFILENLILNALKFETYHHEFPLTRPQIWADY